MKRLLGALILPVALVATACGSSGSTTPSSTPPSSSGGQTSSSGGVALSAKNVSGLGTVLVNAQGRTLYVFAPDNGKKVTCTSACQKVWPPLSVGSGQKPSASGGAKASLISTASNPAGGQVVTYAGWPLYNYVADPTAGTAHGQALNSSGGLWYVISPSGTVIKKRPSTKSGTGSGY